MNNQEIFDKVIAHAREQNCRAANSQGACRYRTENGLKCFIGALIPDELYHPSLEGYTPHFSSNCSTIQKKFNKVMNDCGIQNDQFKFVSQLQEIHDSHSLTEWEFSFEKFAEKNDLIYTPLVVQ